jgi:hypothetical protein
LGFCAKALLRIYQIRVHSRKFAAASFDQRLSAEICGGVSWLTAEC